MGFPLFIAEVPCCDRFLRFAINRREHLRAQVPFVLRCRGFGGFLGQLLDVFFVLLDDSAKVIELRLRPVDFDRFVPRFRPAPDARLRFDVRLAFGFDRALDWLQRLAIPVPIRASTLVRVESARRIPHPRLQRSPGVFGEFSE